MKVWRLAAVAAFLLTPSFAPLATAQSSTECRNRYDPATAKVYYGCAPVAPKAAPIALDDDTARVIGWVTRIEDEQGIRLPSWAPQPPFASHESEVQAATIRFSLVQQWTSALMRTTDPATIYFANAVLSAAFAQLYAHKGQMADARTWAHSATVWLDRTQTAYDHH